MAKMVTRTKVITRATVKGMDTTLDTAVVYTVDLPGTYKTDKDVMEAVQKRTDADSPVKPVTLMHCETAEVLYGMAEDKFLANAEILPARKDYKKANER